MSRLLRRVAPLALVLVSCSVVSDPAPVARSASAYPPLSPPALEAHVAYLASDALEGREAGTPGGEVAARYVAEVMALAGLDAVEEQPFEFISGARLGSRNEMAIGGKGLPDDAFRPLAFSAAVTGEWPAVFAGYGIEASELEHRDYEGLEVGGRAVVVLAGSPDGDNPHGRFGDHAGTRAKALEAAHRGVGALVILVTGDDGEETLPQFRGDSISRDVGLPVVAVKASAAAPLLGLDVAGATASLDGNTTVSRPLDATIRLRVDVTLERRITRNVLGWLRARHPRATDELVIVGAHHDHLGHGISGSLAPDRRGEVHNGADDNASGVAGVLELARALVPRAAELRRHVLFMTFGAEEWGLLGSKYFKDHPILRLPGSDGGDVAVTPVAMINMDMIGRLRDDRLLASGVATSDEWSDLLESIRAEKHPGLTLSADKAKELLGSSDHIAFYQMEIPVVFFFTGNHSEYHKPEDDLYRTLEDGSTERLVNIDGMSTLLGFVEDVVVTVANRDEPLPLKEGINLTPRMSFSVVLRLLPDYGADVEGMRVAGVTPGGPAEKAGLREGDVIVRFGDTPVRSVRDYMVGLQKAEPGEAIEVEVRRDGEPAVLEVMPEGAPRSE